MLQKSTSPKMKAKNMNKTTGLTVSDRLNLALLLPNGARFYRCALQVNPFGYLASHKKKTSFQTEADYNTAIVATCQELGIEVIGVTDHYRVKDSLGLVKAAREAGIFAFSGFEAVTKDGVHFLCLFDPEKEGSQLEHMLAEIAPLVKSVSVLPHTQHGVYKQAPYEGIAYEEYAERKSKFLPIDWSGVLNISPDLAATKFCSNDTCELVSK